MEFYIVDAFTNKAFCGNTAGVVLLDDEFISDEIMLNLANEFKYSETAFVKRISKNSFHLRYFTPNSEIDLCGHATVAAFKVLSSLDLCENLCKVNTLAGEIFVKIYGDEVYMSMAKPVIVKSLTVEENARFCKILGIKPTYGEKFLPQIVSTGLPDLILKVQDENELLEISPDFKALSDISKEYNIVGVHAFCLGENSCKVRNFAPLYDIDEEAATGTANAALTHYLRDKAINITNFHQGENMGRPSLIKTKIENDEIFVGGEAFIVARGTIEKPSLI